MYPTWIKSKHKESNCEQVVNIVAFSFLDVKKFQQIDKQTKMLESRVWNQPIQLQPQKILHKASKHPPPGTNPQPLWNVNLTALNFIPIPLHPWPQLTQI